MNEKNENGLYLQKLQSVEMLQRVRKWKWQTTCLTLMRMTFQNTCSWANRSRSVLQSCKCLAFHPNTPTSSVSSSELSLISDYNQISLCLLLGFLCSLSSHAPKFRNASTTPWRKHDTLILLIYILLTFLWTIKLQLFQVTEPPITVQFIIYEAENNHRICNFVITNQWE